MTSTFDLTHENVESLDVRKANVVELRYFGGLSVEETAAIVNVSVETGRGWLLSQIAG
jgi:DNA-directed RNA polymerase specialized sigma24 family protein